MVLLNVTLLTFDTASDFLYASFVKVKSGIFFHRRVILSYRAAEAHGNAGHFYKTSTKYFGLNQWSISVTGANIGYRIALIMTGKYTHERCTF